LFVAESTALNSAGCQLLCLDIDGVTFLHSTGLGTLIRLRRAARDAGGDQFSGTRRIESPVSLN
jgi:anti-anti-sigma regulatory factor